MPRTLVLLHGLLLVLIVTASLRADVTLAPLFRDHAVLQQDIPVRIWGRATAGESVSVRFAGQSVMTTAGSDGRWAVVLQPLSTSSTGTDLVVTGRNVLAIHDVLVGEVWLCSGQSNMEMPVEKAAHAEAERAAATWPAIRHLKVDRHPTSAPRETIQAEWQAATPATVGRFSAIGYYFARQLHQELQRPVGIINSSYGGTPIESWMCPAALTGDPAFRAVSLRWQQTLSEYRERQIKHEDKLAQWGRDEASAQGEGEAAHVAFLKRHPRPKAPTNPAGGPFEPSSLFQGMIHPLVSYTLRGVLWYQGESTRNVQHPDEYHGLFAAMISHWRMHFDQPALPFFWVQLPNYQVPGDASNVAWPRIREAQAETLALPQTGMAVAIDVGDRTDIHPRNKQAVARRLGGLALAQVYGQKVESRSPTLARAEREGAALRIHFADADGGLVNRGDTFPALEIAGADRKFQPAEARIEGTTLVVHAAAVSDPVAVRYAWTNCPTATLYARNGLPVAPFRTDRW